jgi:hypothetical protein
MYTGFKTGAHRYALSILIAILMAATIIISGPMPAANAATLALAASDGEDRHATSKQIAIYDRSVSKTDTVIIASSADANFPDALTASGLSD